MDNKVTVIVPVYNVEAYIDRCIESLLNQTVENYYIILVDDGSTDKSGALCDKWANESDIITAFHKVNGGLSDARNFGVNNTHTEYVTFVDSDDYVEPQYIECLINGISDSADMVVTHNIQEYDYSPQKVGPISDEYKVYSPEDALKLLCYERIPTSAWGKLLLTSLAKNNPFPYGKIYEDLFTVYKYFGMSTGVAVNTSQTYHYVQREGSIRNRVWNDKHYDVMEAVSNLTQYIGMYYPSLQNATDFQYYYSANELFVRAFSSDNYFDIIKPFKKVLKRKWFSIIGNSEISIKHKIQFSLMAFCPGLYRVMWIKKRKQ